MCAGTRGGKRHKGSTGRSDSPRLGASSQIWISLSKAGSALPLPCTDMKMPTLRSHTRTGLSPCPTFPHSCLRQRLAQWGPRAVWGRQRFQEAVGPTGPRGRKPACPQVCCPQLSPSPPLWGQQLREGQGFGAASKPSSALLRV